MSKSNYLFLVYPDGHGSCELLGEHDEVLGLCALFSSYKEMIEVVADIVPNNPTSMPVEINFTYRGLKDAD